MSTFSGSIDDIGKALGSTDKNFISFLTTMQKSGTVYKTSEEALAGYQAYLKTTGTATTLATVKTKALSASMKVLSSIGWMVAITAAVEVISAVVKGIDYLTSANERYIESQQTIIDTAKQNIESYDSEISSLEALQSKLIEAKGNKSELAKIQDELNSSIGATPRLLSSEGEGWSIANQKIADRLRLLEALREQSIKDKTTASKNIYNNSKVDNDWGLDEKLSGYFSDSILSNPSEALSDAISEIEGQLNNNNSMAELLADYIEDNFTEELFDAFPNAEEIQKFFDSQYNIIKDDYSEYISNLDTIIPEDALYDILRKFVEINPNDAQGVYDDFTGFINELKSEDINGLVDDYYKSLSDDSVDSSAIYENIREAINSISEDFPQAQNILESYFNSLSTSIPANSSALSDKIASVKEQLESLSNLDLSTSGLSELESAYSTLKNTMKDGLTTDNLESIISLNSEYVNILFDENGQMVDNETAWQNLAKVKIDEAKASVYQQAATELQRIATLDTAEANNELALSNGTLSQTEYELAHSAYVAAFNMGGVRAELANNVWKAAETKVGLLDSKLNDVSTSTYKVKDSYTSTASEFSKQIDFLETRLTELDELTKKVSASMDNMVGSASKNNLVDAMFAIDGNRKETLEKGIKLYQDEASKALAKIPAEYRDMAINGSITLGTFEGKGNEDVVQAIEDYRTWSEPYYTQSHCTTSIHT